MNSYHVYIASCDENGGIYHYIMQNDATFKFMDKTCMPNPMYMAISNEKMYAVLRNPFKNSNESGVIRYTVNKNGTLCSKSEIISTHGEVACHILVSDNDIYCANYTSGSLIKLPDTLVMHSGRSVHPTRQTSPHIHFAAETPDKKYICAVDLGLDKIIVYDRNLNFVSDVKFLDGHGPRHIVFSADGNLAYCANELASTVSVLTYNNGHFTLKDTYNTLPSTFAGKNTMAAIRLHGKYLYVSNRGHDTIVCFKTEGEQLILQSITPCGGNSPRDFDIIGNILICTNEESDNVTLFKLDGALPVKLPHELKITHPLAVAGTLL